MSLAHRGLAIRGSPERTTTDNSRGEGCTIVGMEEPAFDVLGFLAEPGRPASVAIVSGRGRPALAMMVAPFNPPTDVRQVRMTGPARLEEQDDLRVHRLYHRYVSMGGRQSGNGRRRQPATSCGRCRRTAAWP